VTEAGTVVELVDEGARYAHMRAADVALTIPGTNTLELGIAGVPSVVVLPLNRPEVIPLEGPGHWLSLLPLVGVPLKRRAVRLFVERLRYPVSLPNQFSGESLMVEVKGVIDPDGVAAHVATLIDDPEDRAHRRARLLATMPRPGAADRLVERVRAIVDGPGLP
jgi:lipid-A-disaccharide synthase